MDTVTKIMMNIADIPLLSNSANLLLSLIARGDYTVQEVTRIIEQDNVLTAKILKVVNSAAFSLNKEITSIEKAVPFLGERLIQSIAIESCASKVFGKDLEGYGSRQGELWEHSLKTAIASKEISMYSKQPVEGGLAFTAGIMHDIGKSLLSSYLMMNGGLDQIAALIQENPQTDYLEIERVRIGVNHPQAGYLLAKHWKLPDSLTNIVLHHHRPAEAPPQYRQLCFCVHLGDLLSMIIGTGTGIDSMHYKLDENYIKYVDITEDTMYRIILTVEDEFNKIKLQLFG